MVSVGSEVNSGSLMAFFRFTPYTGTRSKPSFS